MRKLFSTVLLVLLLVTTAGAYDTYVNGYQKSDGTQVQGYHRTSPDSTVRNNYSYEGNTNPYTGSTGQNHYRNSPSSEYYNGYGNNKGNSYKNDPFSSGKKNR